MAGITTLAAANRFFRPSFLPEFNAEFTVPPRESGSAFVPYIGPGLQDILCVQEERTVGNDNCVRYEAKMFQLPADRHRCHYVKAKDGVHAYADGTYGVFHGPRKLAHYDANGKETPTKLKAAA